MHGRDSCNILVRKLEGKRPYGRPRYRWENNIGMDLREIEREVVDWILLAQENGPVVGCSEHGNEPLGSIKRQGIL
jgi:hypothetical protein